jgi:triphosphoribosyl-dephospho-CoA synthase
MLAGEMSRLSDELSKAESPEQILPLFYRLDQALKSRGINPGTMADMTVATVLTVFLEAVIKLTLRNKNLPV